MDITHSNFNNAITEMENITAKGQPFAKANKERRIRAVLRDMRKKQADPPLFGDVWFYFKVWLTSLR